MIFIHDIPSWYEQMVYSQSWNKQMLYSQSIIDVSLKVTHSLYLLKQKWADTREGNCANI